ncbi:MAG: twin-arginine translocase subunit TatC [Terriglobales bacterium]
MALLDHLRSSPASADGGATMSFLQHLEELRRRIVYAALGVFLAFCVCFAFADRIYGFIERPMTASLKAYGLSGHLVYFNPVDPFNLYVKLGLICALFLASPWILYQVWAFIRPGLFPRERRYVIPFVVCTSALFLAGGAFAYLYAFPLVLNFLIGYAHRFTPEININEYFNLFSTVVLGVGAVFELPTLIFFLSLFGLTNARWLAKNFRYAILGAFVLAAAITPTADITTMTVFAAPLLGLYGLGIVIAWLVGKSRKTPRRSASA